MIKSTLLLLGFLPFNFLFGQGPISQNKSFACDAISKANDFDNALIADRAYKVTLKCSPSGAGNAKEVQCLSPNSLNYFEKEHNIVWVKFQAVKTSKLAIQILPDTLTDDYDFLLFKDEGEGTKRKIQSKQLKPIRSNLARTKNSADGSTGLKFNAEKTHVRSGVQVSQSKFIEVIQNEIYYLAIDNVYDGGKGAIITFDYFKLTTLEGVIEDSESNPIEAEVVWENTHTGEEIVVTSSNSVTGEYEITVPFNMNPSNQYTLVAFADSCFFSEVTYTPGQLAALERVEINMILPKLRAGNRSSLQNINFVGDKATFLPGAYPSLKRLYKLMKKNPSLVIHIEGHTNGASHGASFSQILSESRAQVSKTYLTDKKIDSKRITTEGLSDRYMLYGMNSGENKQSLNRRIEVLVKAY